MSKTFSVGNLIQDLISRNLSITSMESCTSGMIASMITDTPGASAIFKGGYVTYSNEAKIAAGVPSEIISTYGVYSPECAHAMAKTVQEKFNSDIAIGITGNTGNVDPNNPEGVVGEVYFCIIYSGQSHSYHYSCDVTDKSRHNIKKEYSIYVFQQLHKLITYTK